MNERTTSKSALATMLALLTLGAAGFVMLYVSTSKYGVGITSVSCEYFAAAKSLLDGKGFLLYDGTPYLDYPPLFPMLLAIIGLFRIDPIEAIRFFNALSFGMIIFLSGIWLRRNITFRFLVLLGAAFILFSLDTLNASIFAWPEAIFSLFIIVCLFELEKLLETGKRVSLWRAAVFAGLACSIRYIGVILIATAILCIFLGRKPGFRDKVKNALAFVAVSMTPLLIWLVRNYMVSGTITGERGPSPFPFFKNLYTALSIISGWLFTMRVSPAPRIVLMGVLILLLVWIFVLQRRMRHKSASNGVSVQKVLPAIIYIVLYTITMVVLSSIVALDAMNSRFIIPIYAPLVWVVVSGLENLRCLPVSRLPRLAIRTFSTIYFVVLIVWWGTVEMRWVALYNRNGAGGLSKEEWRSSEIINHLKNTPLDGTVYSNEPWALYMLAGMSAKLAPRKYLFHSPVSTTDDLDNMRSVVAERADVYLVWIERFDRPYLHPLDELNSTFRLEPLREFSDGTIFLVR